MLRTKYFVALIVLFFSKIITAQTLEISGKVSSKTDVENIHIINKTAKFFTVTNQTGNFNISGKLNDTIVFSSIQHKLTEVVITEDIILSKTIFVTLEEQINELDEVIVGKILTGDLNSDINNTEGDPPINFYDVGIPGYTGKIATQSERRLHEATSGGGFIPLNPILNAISGRTKMLKEQVKLEEKDNLLHKIKTTLSKDFFIVYNLDERLRADFFYFCEEDPNFNLRCKNKSDIEIFEFLKEKLFEYKENLNSNKN
ncbi:MAG: hypothetical protein WA839_08175 [Flavobacteriaceae bacterium]